MAKPGERGPGFLDEGADIFDALDFGQRMHRSRRESIPRVPNVLVNGILPV
jgi:hypothetical protein